MTVITVYARDWGCYCDQIDADHEFNLIYGWVTGYLVKEDDEKVVIAHHWFDRDNQVRHVTTVQKSCIVQRHVFEIQEIQL